MIDLTPWLGTVPTAVVDRLRSARNVLAVGHENPDADTHPDDFRQQDAGM